MFAAIVLLAALACQTPPPAPQTGGDVLRSQAWPSPAPKVSPATTPDPAAAAPAPDPTPSVADLFRERNAREAAARAAAESSAAPADGEYRCRRTATSVTCGTDEETMRRTEDEAKAQLDRLFAPN